MRQWSFLMAGDDALSCELLGSAHLTAHAMPSMQELVKGYCVKPVTPDVAAKAPAQATAHPSARL